MLRLTNHASVIKVTSDKADSLFNLHYSFPSCSDERTASGYKDAASTTLKAPVELQKIYDEMEQSMHSSHTTLSSSSAPFVAAEYTHDHKTHLLLAASGSVATIKIPNILSALSSHANLSIRLILTQSALNFLQGQSAEQPHISSFLSRYPNLEGIHLDEEEWVHPWKRGQGILHIELRRWADILVIAPLSANTLAKITGGWADNLLTSVVRAWDTKGEIGVVEGESEGVGSEGTMWGSEEGEEEEDCCCACYEYSDVETSRHREGNQGP